MTTVLIIEDDPTLRGALELKARNEGFTVRSARDGKEGWEEMQKNPDGIILDVFLPVLNGMELLEKRAVNPALHKIPVVLISNSDKPVGIGRARRLGANEVLVKTNITPDEAIAAIKRHIPPGTAAQKVKEKPPRPTNIRTILVVEDDVFLKRLLAEKLKKEGFSVMEADGGRTALSVLETAAPDLILLDIIMPDLDGFRVLEEVRKGGRNGKTPIVVLSNLGEREHIERARKLGADDYLIKAHFTLDEIIERVVHRYQ